MQHEWNYFKYEIINKNQKLHNRITKEKLQTILCDDINWQALQLRYQLWEFFS